MKKNKTMLIVGANSDIAVEVAHKFASGGYDLQLASRTISDLDSITKDLTIRYGVSVRNYEIDILDYDSFGLFIDSLDYLPAIVFCSVGLLGNQKDDEKHLPDSSLIMRSNYEGPALLLGMIATKFENRGSGSILAISSVAGERGRANNYLYGSAKGGFSVFLSGLRNRLFASNINVLDILPGFVDTKMTSHLNLPKFITISPKKLADLIFKNHLKNKKLYIFPWKLIMIIIRFIPEGLFIRMKI